MELLSSLQDIRTLDELIVWGGYALLFAMVFAETGLFAGFFLPGDSLLITAGLIAASGKLDILPLVLTLILGAILGDSTGYLIGTRLRKSIFSKRDTLFFHQEHLRKTRLFYDRHGAKAVFLARFAPIVRSFAATLAGVAGMSYPLFLFFSCTGTVVWVLCFTFLGFFVARAFPHLVEVVHSVILIGIVIILFSAIRRLRRSAA
jgi:membrane-associated protein